MIRILQVFYGMNCGGAENMIMNIYRNIDREKVQFDFLSHYGKEAEFNNEIRSLGGRKIDVANLFNAEAFIIGFLAGIFGITVTYLISLIINLIMAGIIGYSTIAALPLWQAVVLILLSVGLTCLSGIIPASSAARKDPVIALRTE